MVRADVWRLLLVLAATASSQAITLTVSPTGRDDAKGAGPYASLAGARNAIRAL